MGRHQMIRKQKMPNEQFFFELRKFQSQYNGRETQKMAVNKLEVFSEQSISRQHVNSRHLVRKQKIFVIKNFKRLKIFNSILQTNLIYCKQE